MSAKQVTQEVTDDQTWWTLDKAALHIGVTRATVERYVREGLRIHFRELGGWVDRDEFLAAYRERVMRQRARFATRQKDSPA